MRKEILGLESELWEKGKGIKREWIKIKRENEIGIRIIK